MRIYYDTTEYHFSHGRAPRGIGQWAFQVTPEPGRHELFWAWGTYTEAKRHVARYVRENGCCPDVKVMP